MAGDRGDPGSPWLDDHGLASALADGVVVLAPGGAIVWVNDAFCTLLGQDRAELLGTNGLTLVQPDELARAVDGLDYATRFAGRTAVESYQIRAGDGSWMPVELKSGTIDGPGGDHLALVIRDGTARRDINRALQSVASGEPLGATATIVGEAIGSRWANSSMAISVGERDGKREVLGSSLQGLLADHAAGRVGHLGVAAPWELVGPGEVVIVDRTEMPDALRRAAEAAGFEGFGVAGVADPVGQPGCLVVWFDYTAIGRLEFRHAAAELTELLGLAVERRHHLWQLGHVASHDSLTGLLNRGGFFDRFGEQVERARTTGQNTTALLFVDLDGLKGVNDAGGHAAGDRLLVDVAERLRSVVTSPSTVARLGGDEFVVSTTYPADEAKHQAEALAQVVVDALALPWSGLQSGTAQVEVSMAASVGIALDDGDIAPVRILERADAAMYRAKSAGRSRWAW